MVKAEFIKQYEHTWSVFERIVEDFDNGAWKNTGRGTTTPVRLSFHILKAVKYYLEDSGTIHFDSGKSFESNSETAQDEDLPSQKDIMICIDMFRGKTEKWLNEMDFNAEIKSFEWAGATKLGVVIFLLRHSLYHMGELSSLLNESKNGAVEDHYVNAL